jgi:hypothetical protein
MESNMRKTTFLVGLLLAATPALAAEDVPPADSPANAASPQAMEPAATPSSGKQYYVQQNTETKECDIGSKVPDGQKIVAIGPAYATQEEAIEARKTAPECKGHFGQG